MKKDSREDRSSPTQDKLTAGNGGWRSLLLPSKHLDKLSRDLVMVVRRKTNVFLVRFMFICEAVWIIVNFIYLRKLFRVKLLVTSTGKTNISPRKTKFRTKKKNPASCFLKKILTVPGPFLLLPFFPGTGLLLLLLDGEPQLLLGQP